MNHLPSHADRLSNGMKKFLRICFSTLALVAVFPFTTLAAPALDSIPDAVKSRYEFDGSITSVVSDGTTLYVGGNFTQITLRSGEPFSRARNYLAAFDVSDGLLIEAFDPNLNGGVTSLALSSDGSTLYMGGSFWCVGGEFEAACLESERFNLAAINTTTGNATAFDPSPDGEVNTIALSSDDTTLFAGGSFIDVNSGTTRNYLAAFTTADGIATDFDPNMSGAVRSIKLSVDESTIYAAGNFTAVNGDIPQQYIAEFDSDTGDITNFNSALGGSGQALALSDEGTPLDSSDDILYVGGEFTQFTTRSGEGVPFNETTQVPVAVYPKISTAVGGPGATVYTSIPDGDGGWYIGGSFTHVGTTTQEGLAHITADGLFDAAFRPSFTGNATVYTLELSPDGSVLYAGGLFFSGSEQYAAAFNTTNGATTAFSPYPGGTVYDLELSSDGETLYLGGDFISMTGGFTPRFNVAAMDTTGAGTLLALDPQVSGAVNALQLSGNGSTLYFGGTFTNVHTETTNNVRNRIAAFTTAGVGAVTAFNPNADGAVYTLAFGPSEATLYAGGAFANIGGAVREEFAELSIALNGTATALDAEIVNPMGDTVLTIALSSDESTIYIGGEGFSTIDGASRTMFAEINATTGAVTDFNPQFGDAVRSISVSSLDGEVYIGGSFTGYGTVSAPYLLGIDLSDSSLVTAFTPVPGAAVYTLALSSDDTLLYAGGDFVDVNNGTSRDYLAAFSTTNGTATAFDPVGTSYVYGLGLAADDTELYVGNYNNLSGTSTLFIFDVAAGGGSETLTVSKDGTGLGTVSSAPAGIDCGVDCTEDFDADTEVTLTASATAGSDFMGWAGGGCAGTGVCVITMSSVQSVTATFDLEEEVPEDDDGGGSSGSVVRHSSGFDITVLMERLIGLLEQYLALLIAAKSQ